VFPESFREEFLRLSGDIGGRSVRDANTKRCYGVTPECPMNFIDIDNMEDYQRLLMEDKHYDK